MLIMISKYLFALTSFILTVMTVYGKLFVFKKRKPQFVSDYCATMAGLIGLYVLLALVLVLFFPAILFKTIMFLFAISPFIIGLLVKYETEKYYTVIQVLLFICGMVFVLL